MRLSISLSFNLNQQWRIQGRTQRFLLLLPPKGIGHRSLPNLLTRTSHRTSGSALDRALSKVQFAFPPSTAKTLCLSLSRIYAPFHVSLFQFESTMADTRKNPTIPTATSTQRSQSSESAQFAYTNASSYFRLGSRPGSQQVQLVTGNRLLLHA